MSSRRIAKKKLQVLEGEEENCCDLASAFRQSKRSLSHSGKMRCGTLEESVVPTDQEYAEWSLCILMR